MKAVAQAASVGAGDIVARRLVVAQAAVAVMDAPMPTTMDDTLVEYLRQSPDVASSYLRDVSAQVLADSWSFWNRAVKFDIMVEHNFTPADLLFYQTRVGSGESMSVDWNGLAWGDAGNGNVYIGHGSTALIYGNPFTDDDGDVVYALIGSETIVSPVGNDVTLDLGGGKSAPVNQFAGRYNEFANNKKLMAALGMTGVTPHELATNKAYEKQSGFISHLAGNWDQGLSEEFSGATPSEAANAIGDAVRVASARLAKTRPGKPLDILNNPNDAALVTWLARAKMIEEKTGKRVYTESLKERDWEAKADGRLEVYNSEISKERGIARASAAVERASRKQIENQGLADIVTIFKQIARLNGELKNTRDGISRIEGGLLALQHPEFLQPDQDSKRSLESRLTDLKLRESILNNTRAIYEQRLKLVLGRRPSVASGIDISEITFDEVDRMTKKFGLGSRLITGALRRMKRSFIWL